MLYIDDYVNLGRIMGILKDEAMSSGCSEIIPIGSYFVLYCGLCYDREKRSSS